MIGATPFTEEESHAHVILIRSRGHHHSLSLASLTWRPRHPRHRWGSHPRWLWLSPLGRRSTEDDHSPHLRYSPCQARWPRDGLPCLYRHQPNNTSCQHYRDGDDPQLRPWRRFAASQLAFPSRPGREWLRHHGWQSLYLARRQPHRPHLLYPPAPL